MFIGPEKQGYWNKRKKERKKEREKGKKKEWVEEKSEKERKTVFIIILNTNMSVCVWER